jgi:hypothetical protein
MLLLGRLRRGGWPASRLIHGNLVKDCPVTRSREKPAVI